jgi:hypothetical protein
LRLKHHAALALPIAALVWRGAGKAIEQKIQDWTP